MTSTMFCLTQGCQTCLYLVPNLPNPYCSWNSSTSLINSWDYSTKFFKLLKRRKSKFKSLPIWLALYMECNQSSIILSPLTIFKKLHMLLFSMSATAKSQQSVIFQRKDMKQFSLPSTSSLKGWFPWKKGNIWLKTFNSILLSGSYSLIFSIENFKQSITSLTSSKCPSIALLIKV